MDSRGGCIPLTDAQRDEAEKHLDLCRSAATWYERKTHRLVSRHEFLGVAFEGLADAVQKYDESRGVPFRAYARCRVGGGCLDMLRSQKGGVIRVSRGGAVEATATTSLDALDAEFGCTLADSLVAPEEDPAGGREEAEQVAACLRKMGYRERHILTWRYGLGGAEVLTQKQIADRLGILQPTVSRAEKTALAEFRQHYESL